MGFQVGFFGFRLLKFRLCQIAPYTTFEHPLGPTTGGVFPRGGVYKMGIQRAYRDRGELYEAHIRLM